MRVGILGGGQLAQMLMLAGYPLGIGTTCYEATDGSPASLVGNVTKGDVTETGKLHNWARNVDVITYEWENFPAELVADLSETKPVHPGPNALAATQDRWAEKRLFSALKIPIPAFRAVTDQTELQNAIDELEGPVVVKTRSGGYDGKGQAVVRTDTDLDDARALVARADCIVEQWIPFEQELSIIGVRGRNGETVTYPVTQNEHRSGILHASIVPASISSDTKNLAEQYMHLLLDQLQYVGVLALEMFEIGGRLLANEMAPRVHNSGHWTIEGARTSQFENHLRAVCGLPLGSTEMREPTAMINFIGAVPSPSDVLAIPGAHLHLYGKAPRPGRKLGHVTITAPTEAELRKSIEQVSISAL